MHKKGRIINLIIWGFLTVLWTVLTVFKVTSSAEAWEIAMNALVAVLSLVNLVIHLVFLVKKK